MLYERPLSVTPPDREVLAEAEQRQERLVKPAGSLGRLEELGCWVASCQGQCPPQPISAPRVVIFAGDHGVAARGVSAYPTEVTGQMTSAVLDGTAAISVLAATVGAEIRVVDMAVDAATPDPIASHKIRRGSGAIDVEDALTPEEAVAAIDAGRAIAATEIDSGADLLALGDLGIGSTTVAAVVIAKLTDSEPTEVVGRGTGIDDRAWMRKVSAIRDALWRARGIHGDPGALLAAIGSADLAAMTGFLAEAAARRVPVILDGVVTAAAALLADRLAPGARCWWVAGHQSTEPAHDIALYRLELEPLLTYGMHLGQGSGAVLAVPIVRAATEVLARTATSSEAGVSGPIAGVPMHDGHDLLDAT